MHELIESISLGMTGPKKRESEDGKKKPPEPVGFLVARGTFNGEKLMAAADLPA